MRFPRLLLPRRLPSVQSTEAAECGLACLVMIARVHGHDVDLNGLRKRFSVSMAGATLRGLMTFADALGFAARPVRVEPRDLSKLQLPAILHWDMNHFVVLKSVRGGRAVIHDPASGVRRMRLSELSSHFTGVALELTPTPGMRPLRATEPVRLHHLWSHTIGLWPAIFQVLALSVALQVVAFALPLQIQFVVDEALARNDAALLAVIAVSFGVLVGLQAGIEVIRSLVLQRFGQLLSFQMIGNLVRHLLRLPSDWFEKRHVGDILSRLTSATAIQDVLTRGVISTLIDGTMAIFALAIMAAYSWRLSMIVVVAVALNAVLTLALFPAMRRRSEEQLTERAREQSHMMESVRASTTIKLMQRETEREAVWRNLYANAMNAALSLGTLQVTATGVQNLITGLQTVLVIYFGSLLVIAGEFFSIGMLLAFLAFRQTFTDRANGLIGQLIEFRFIGMHLDRLADIVTADPDTAPSAVNDPTMTGGLTLRSVGFSYGPTDPLVLDDIDLTVKEGEFLAISGPSGGGKTTLLKLLLGLRTPTTGVVRLGDRDASPEAWRAWREKLGVVAQDDKLLSGTIAENIAFFDPDMDMDRVREAADQAQVCADIDRMAMGFHALVGDMGSVLSGGQRQRVLLARALYRRPQILVLDEGTANLDVRTEELIADVLARMTITRIVVAHRPALLKRADRVLVLDKGRLSPAGQTQDVPPTG